jgi:hypothetical protein
VFAARNLTEEERKGHREVKWDDPDVCGPFMVRFCPHDLFVNTKSNLGISILPDSSCGPIRLVLYLVVCFADVFRLLLSGPCLKIHDSKLKERLGRLCCEFS